MKWVLILSLLAVSGCQTHNGSEIEKLRQELAVLKDSERQPEAEKPPEKGLQQTTIRHASGRVDVVLYTLGSDGYVTNLVVIEDVPVVKPVSEKVPAEGESP